MARIPDKYSLSQQPSLRSGRQIAQGPDISGLVRGVQQLGAGISDIGTQFAREEKQKRDQATTLGAATAEANYTEQALDTQNRAEADPDYTKSPAKYGAELDKALSASAQSIPDENVRERWLTMKREEVVRQKDALGDGARKKETSTKLVQLDGALEKNRRLYVDKNTPDDVREKVRKDIEGAISMSEKSGLLTPEAGADARFKYLEGADFTRGLMEVERNPNIIARPLPPTVAERSTRAMDYFQSRGWTKAQAAGIVGNLIHESGGKLSPGARNPGDGADGSDSIGLAQWNSDRARRLKEFAALNKADWQDYGIQLAFVDHELRSNEKGAGDKLKQAQNLQDATDAFIGYERPLGSDKGARNAHGYDNRLRMAAQAAGEDVNPEWYKRVSPEAREKFDAVSEARQGEIDKQRVAEAKVYQQQSIDDFNLKIATNPAAVTQTEILNNPFIDNGDRATLIKALNSARDENQGVNEFISALGTGQSVSINPYDSDQTKIANKAFDQMIAAAPEDQRGLLTSSVIAQTAYIPEKVQSEIRRGMATTSVPEMTQALTTADQLERIAPVSMKSMMGHEQVEKNLTAFRHFTQDMGYSADEASRKVISLNDPAMAAQRDAIMKSEPIKKYLKDVSVTTVADIFDSAVSFEPSLGDVPTQQEISVGYTPESEAAIVADYKSILEEGIADAGGDTTLGKKMADERFQKMYGTSGLTMAGDRSVIKLPPERAYPADVNGSHDYIREQAMDDLKVEGIDATDVFLQPYEQTERDVSSGRPANYQLFYVRDGKLEKLPNPFIADPLKANETAVKKSAEAQRKNVAEAKQDSDRLEAVIKRTEGMPDNVRAQEMMIENARINNEKEAAKAKAAREKATDEKYRDQSEDYTDPNMDVMGNPF